METMKKKKYTFLTDIRKNKLSYVCVFAFGHMDNLV